MEKRLLLELNLIHKDFLEKTKEITNYYIYNQYLNYIVEKQEIGEIKILLNIKNQDTLNFDNFYKSKVSMQGKYDAINLDVIYKSNFQSFEEYLSEILYCCFFFFPKFMNKIDLKHSIPLEKIFEDSISKEDIKDYLITFKVKTIIQSSNILEIISKIEKTFSLKFNLQSDELNMLYFNSLVRNLLTHNNGVINDVFINQLKLKKIPFMEFDKNSKIRLTTSTCLKHGTNQLEIADKIFDCIAGDVKRLCEYHKSLEY